MKQILGSIVSIAYLHSLSLSKIPNYGIKTQEHAEDEYLLDLVHGFDTQYLEFESVVVIREGVQGEDLRCV